MHFRYICAALALASGVDANPLSVNPPKWISDDNTDGGLYPGVSSSTNEASPFTTKPQSNPGAELKNSLKLYVPNNSLSPKAYMDLVLKALWAKRPDLNSTPALPFPGLPPLRTILLMYAQASALLVAGGQHQNRLSIIPGSRLIIPIRVLNPRNIIVVCFRHATSTFLPSTWATIVGRSYTTIVRALDRKRNMVHILCVPECRFLSRDG